MTFLAPGFLWAAGAMALATAVLHLLAWRQPPTVPLPTARFVPERTMRVMARTVKLTDVGLLALRVLLIACAGVALARPVLAARRVGAVSVVVADLSRGVESRAEVRDSVRSRAREGDVLVAFGREARELASLAALDSLATATAGDLPEPVGGRGSLSAAFVVAIRAAERLRARHDTVRVVLVSPVLAEEMDAATLAVRERWAGPVAIVPVAPRRAPEAGAVTVRAPADDPVRVALALSGERLAPDESGATRLLVRGAATAADAAWVREGRGRVLVTWPASETLAPEASGLARGARVDTAYGVLAASGVHVGVMPRAVEAAARSTTGSSPESTRGAHVVARWADGTPAAIERVAGGGCTRAVTVPVAATGDVALTASFGRLARDLVAPCGGAMDSAPVAPALLRAIARAPEAAGAGGDAQAVPPADADRSRRLAAWLLASALALAVLELALRRGAGRVVA